MDEIELKLQVPAAKRKAVDAGVAGSTAARRVRLQAAYVDTPSRALADARMALRVRREGRQWVQTLKAAGDDGMTRPEHNVVLGSGAAAPPADPSLHAGTPVGERLSKLLGQRGEPLEVVYRTDVLRRTRRLRTRLGTVELAFDEGAILAGDQRLAVCELEVELVAGSGAAVIDAARRWQARHGLWLDTRSKSERGQLLAAGKRQAPPRRAAAVELKPRMSAADAWTAVLRSCAEQVGANAAQIAAGEYGDEHVHQLRVGLRRLRTALRLFAFIGADAGLEEPTAALFRRLGGARDGAVVEAEFAGELRTALGSVVAKAADLEDGLPGAAGGAAGKELDVSVNAQVAAPAPPPDADADADPVAVVRDRAVQSLLFDLIAAASGHGPASHVAMAATAESAAAPAGAASVAAPEAATGTATAPGPKPKRGDGNPAEPPWPDRLARRMKRWHQSAAADAARFAALDVDARHRLRKRIKRLRYALEFSAGLFPRRAVRRYLKPLRALQERLGQINDVAVAMAAYGATRDTDGQAWFALGWLAARRDALITAARTELKAFAKARPFWK